MAPTTFPPHQVAACADGISNRIIGGLFVWMLVTESAILGLMISSGKPVTRAVGLTAGGLLVLWNVGFGLCTWRNRERVRAFVLDIRCPWPLKFVLFCTILALLEEVVTATMTNLAPVFGVPVGAAYITASANYLDVVCLHSVVVFIPMFVWWAWTLKRWDYRPSAVFLLFGATGVLAEMSFSRVQAFIGFGFWCFVYGLMIYLPAYSLPDRPAARAPQWWRYPLAVVLPIPCVALVAGIVHLLHPIKMHFPPLHG